MGVFIQIECVLVDVQYQSTTIPSSPEQTTSLKIDKVFYDVYLLRIIADKHSSASKKGEGLFESKQ